MIPVIGGDLLIFSADGKTQTLDQWLASGLARELDIPLEGLPTPPSLNDVTHAYFDLVGIDPANRRVDEIAL